MTDQAKRELERADPGDLRAQVELLQQRRRQGQLDDVRLWTAAWAGHAAARQVLGQLAPEPFAPLGDAGVRPSLAVAWACLEAARPDAAHAEAHAEASQALRRWLDGELELDELERLADELVDPLEGVEANADWHLLTRERSARLRAEFLREVAPPNPCPVRDLLPFASAYSQDDVAAIVLQGATAGSVCEVHLTWRGSPEAPGWPTHNVYPGIRSWLGARWGEPDEPPVDFLAAVPSLALTPATLREQPALNGYGAFGALIQAWGAAEAQARVGRILTAWALG